MGLIYIMEKNKELLKLKNRRIIYDYITKNPGLHLREIFRKIELSEGTIKYHINYLEKKELIISKKEYGYKRFYKNMELGKEDKKIWILFRKKTTRNIILYLLIYMASSRIKLSKELEINPKKIEYYLKKLIEYEIIEETIVKNNIIKLKNNNPKYKKYKTKSNEIVYVLKDKQMIEDFILRYKKNFKYDDVPLNCIAWIDFLRNSKMPNVLKDNYEKDDDFVEIFLNVFPIPFCA